MYKRQPFDRNTWNATDGNGPGNRQGIAIEICYSKSGGERFIQAEKNAAEYIAKLLKERNWGLDRVTRHYDYFPEKGCPHRTMAMGWQRFLDMVAAYMGGEAPRPVPTPVPSTKAVSYTHLDVYKRQTLNRGFFLRRRRDILPMGELGAGESPGRCGANL